MNDNKIPVLLIAFKRPEETKKVLDKINEYFPEKLYFFVDHSDQNELKNKEVKELISLKNYASNVYKYFPKNNLGCGFGPVTAINWILSKEKYAIILEDDCVPLNGFFEFMEWWLNKKEKDNNCFMVSGNNYPVFSNKMITTKTKFAFTHGWGTWSRAWSGYDYNISSWNTDEFKIKLIPFYTFRRHWVKIFDKISKDNSKTYWDYQWQYHIWKKKGYSLQPPVNLIKNIGFNKNASHTVDENDWRGRIPAKSIPLNFKDHSPKFNFLTEFKNMIIDLNIASFILRFFLKIKK